MIVATGAVTSGRNVSRLVNSVVTLQLAPEEVKMTNTLYSADSEGVPLIIFKVAVFAPEK